MKLLAATAVLIAALGASASAQTNDHFFRSWRWTVAPSEARAAGLGGAVDALGGDPTSALANPAGLATLSKSAFAAGLQNRGAGSASDGDRLDARTSLGAAVVAWRARTDVTVAAFATEPQARGLTLSLPALADGLADNGALQGSVTDVGVAASWHAAAWVQVGGRLAASRLSLAGTYTRAPAAGAAALQVETAGRDTQLSGSAGALFELSPRLHLGLVLSSGTTWTVARTASSPDLGAVLESNGQYQVRAPRVSSGALRFEPSHRWAFFGQIDFVRYGDAQSALVIGQGAHARSDYALKDAWEPRAGVEVSIPRRRFSLQLRAGIHLQAPGLLRYVGSDPVEGAAFVGDRRRVVAAAGASLVTARWLRFDIATRLGEQTEILAGAAARF